MKRLRVLMTREEIVPERLAGATAVVVDVFLTTLLTILENGARQIFPVASLEEAEEARRELDASNVLRGAPDASPSRTSSGRRPSSPTWTPSNGA